MTDLKQLGSALFGGDVGTARKLLASARSVDDQRIGRCDGAVGLDKWVQETIAWAQSLKARCSVVASLQSSKRCVVEMSLDITVDEQVVDLPYVLVADIDNEAISALRTYHSTWPYTGSHVFRAPPLTGTSCDPIPAWFQRYVDQVSNAEVDEVLESFAEDGYLREPSGLRWQHRGPEERAKFYGHLKSAPRATFILNSCLEDGASVAVEYSFSYGDTPMVGGVCIMERVAERIAAVRIADDVGA